ncbi:leucine-responsive transcriptional regulator Lrp [Sedimenticola sp.]|uniref:leucine-responsive transcriptional regulator Lrp n=1 Tax=Sedimenticola sp. TaxID=1940285 RepID=UPI003D14681C
MSIAKKSQARLLDRIDRRILRTLQVDGRISYVELGKAVGLSTSPCLERVKRLEQEGYIKGYCAILNPQLLAASLLIYVEVSLEYNSSDIFDQFRSAVLKLTQVQECHLVSGDFDYLIKVRISDMASYRELLGEIMHGLPGVRDTKSYVVMEELKETLSIDIPG